MTEVVVVMVMMIVVNVFMTRNEGTVLFNDAGSGT